MKKIVLCITLTLTTGCTSIASRDDNDLCYRAGWYYTPKPVESLKYEAEYLKRNKEVSEQCTRLFNAGANRWAVREAKANNGQPSMFKVIAAQAVVSALTQPTVVIVN